jgi:hypothetical protein
MSRKAIPESLKRRVLVEAGHRCAIPTCRQTTTELAHIIPYSKVKEHAFDNLISLCPNCHSRYDKGEIDRQSMLKYKANLTILNSRYGDLEKRVLHTFAGQPNASDIKLPGGSLIFVKYLLDDGLLQHLSCSEGHKEHEFPNYDLYRLTDKGREFVMKWISPQTLE